ncbi:hypothetical protein CVT26_010686 [Gymnopilus dilepis]|uniref:Uncharacterized protein n=1 Tax=Gymnopilus dilepis TaxID=231916 RepID=A0A409Y0U3_9AGAR|nr:hypothetical protein CVT26_010686 [Gymnopilus dilepis]
MTVERLIRTCDERHTNEFKRWLRFRLTMRAITDLPKELCDHPYFSHENREIWVVREEFKSFTRHLVIASDSERAKAALWKKRNASKPLWAKRDSDIVVFDDQGEGSSQSGESHVDSSNGGTPSDEDGPSTPKKRRVMGGPRVLIDLTLSPAMERIISEEGFA